jgi:hypothetical protein
MYVFTFLRDLFLEKDKSLFRLTGSKIELSIRNFTCSRQSVYDNKILVVVNMPELELQWDGDMKIA